MSDVLFTHSYFLRFDPKEFRAMMPYPPLGTLYAASSVRSRGYSVGLFDSMLAVNEQELRAVMRRERPRALVIYDDDFNYLTKMCLTRMRDAAFLMSSLARSEGCAVLIHGSDATDHAAEYLNHGAEAVVVGEGEQCVGEFLDWRLRGIGDRDSIQGLAYQTGGEVRHTTARRPLRELDEIPFPARDLIDMQAYRKAWKSRHGYFSTNMVTTRGCPFHCNWCAKPLYGQVYNTRSPQAVAQEMRELKNACSPDHLWFCDDIFGLRPGWIREFADEVERCDARIPFKCQARVDLLLHEDAIQQLARSGCVNVWVGAESGSQKILDAMEKGTTVAQIHEASRRLQRAGIRVGFFLQYGYPGETREDIELTLQMVRECRPDDIGISVSYPLPGTKFYEDVRRDLGEKQNWVDSQDLALMFHGTFMPDFYRTLHRITHKRLRIWQASDLLRSPGFGLLRPGVFRRLASGCYHRLTLSRLETRLRALEGSPKTCLAPPEMIQSETTAVEANRPDLPMTARQAASPLQAGPETMEAAPDRNAMTGIDTDMTRRAFDAAAPVYDSAYERLPGIRRIRSITAGLYMTHFQPGSSLLEINCGTGNDALFLAARGMSILATDLSPEMLRETERKAAAAGLGRSIVTRCLSFERLGELGGTEFDGAYSNLGGLNCTRNLSRVAEGLAAVVKPGGILIATLMPSFCLWETAAFAARGQWRRAFRRRSREGVKADLHGGVVRTWYHSPRRFFSAFAARFDHVRTMGLLIFLPPPNFARAYARLGRAAGWLAHLDDLAAEMPPFPSIGDHFVTVLRRKPQ